MHQFNQLLERDEVAWDRPDTCTNQDAIELPTLELGGDYRLRGLTKVGETMVCVIDKSLQPFFGGGESRQHFCGGHPGKCGEVGRREIDQIRVQPDNQGTPFCRITGALRLGESFNVHNLDVSVWCGLRNALGTPNGRDQQIAAKGLSTLQDSIAIALHRLVRCLPIDA